MAPLNDSSGRLWNVTGGTRFVASVHGDGHEGPWPSRWSPLIRLLEARSYWRPADPGGLDQGTIMGRQIHSATLPVGTGLWTVPVTYDGPESRRYFALRTTAQCLLAVVVCVSPSLLRPLSGRKEWSQRVAKRSLTQ